MGGEGIGYRVVTQLGATAAPQGASLDLPAAQGARCWAARKSSAGRSSSKWACPYQTHGGVGSGWGGLITGPWAQSGGVGLLEWIDGDIAACIIALPHGLGAEATPCGDRQWATELGCL